MNKIETLKIVNAIKLGGVYDHVITAFVSDDGREWKIDRHTNADNSVVVYATELKRIKQPNYRLWSCGETFLVGNLVNITS